MLPHSKLLSPAPGPPRRPSHRAALFLPSSAGMSLSSAFSVLGMVTALYGTAQIFAYRYGLNPTSWRRSIPAGRGVRSGQ